MDTSILESLSASGWPLISSPLVPQLSLENPSTMQLALIGLFTLAAYRVLKHSPQRSEDELVAEPFTHRATDSERKAA